MSVYKRFFYPIDTCAFFPLSRKTRELGGDTKGGLTLEVYRQTTQIHRGRYDDRRTITRHPQQRHPNRLC